MCTQSWPACRFSNIVAGIYFEKCQKLNLWGKERQCTRPGNLVIRGPEIPVDFSHLSVLTLVESLHCIGSLSLSLTPPQPILMISRCKGINIHTFGDTASGAKTMANAILQPQVGISHPPSLPH